MNPYQVSQDSITSRVVDGLVILIIGIAAGLVAGSALMYKYAPSTEVRRIITNPNSTPQIESGIKTDIPSGLKIEEG